MQYNTHISFVTPSEDMEGSVFCRFSTDGVRGQSSRPGGRSPPLNHVAYKREAAVVIPGSPCCPGGIYHGGQNPVSTGHEATLHFVIFWLYARRYPSVSETTLIMKKIYPAYLSVSGFWNSFPCIRNNHKTPRGSFSFHLIQRRMSIQFTVRTYINFQ